MQKTSATQSVPPRTATANTPATGRRPGRSGSSQSRRRAFLADPTTPPEAPLLALGPLRPAAVSTTPATKPVVTAAASAAASAATLREQGVQSLELRHQGQNAEVRLQWRQGGGVVEARLTETGRGVEIQLAAGPDQQRLLHRVAETLSSQRGEAGFDLDNVEVGSDKDFAHEQRQGRQAPPQDDSAMERTTAARRRRRRRAAQPLLPVDASASYCR